MPRDIAREGRSTRSALLLLGYGAFGLLVFAPISTIVLFAVFPEFNELSFARPFANFSVITSEPRLITAIGNSFGIGIAVCVVASLIATPLAYFRAQLPPRQGAVWDAICVAPFLIPPYINAAAWIAILQRNGYAEQLFGFNGHHALFSMAGVVMLLALNNFSLIYFSMSNAFQLSGRKYSEPAAVYGAGPWRQFFEIMAPLAAPALIASNLIVFILALEEFGTVEIVGSRFHLDVIVTLIHEFLTDWPIDLAIASTLSMLLVGTSFMIFVVYQYLAAAYDVSVTVTGKTAAPERASLSFRIASSLVIGLVGVLAVGAPLAGIVTAAFMERISGGLAWDNFSTANFDIVFTLSSGALDALGASIALALATAAVAVMLGLLVAIIVVRLKPRGAATLEFVSLLPNALPGMALAVGLILTWNQAFWPATPYNTTLMLLIAYVALTSPYPTRLLVGALRQTPRSLDEAAFVFGASEATVALRILAPILSRVALASAALVFAISSRELVASLLLAPPGLETASTFAFKEFDQGSLGVGMAVSLVSIVVSGSFIALGLWMQQARAGRTS